MFFKYVVLIALLCVPFISIGQGLEKRDMSKFVVAPLTKDESKFRLKTKIVPRKKFLLPNGLSMHSSQSLTVSLLKDEATYSDYKVVAYDKADMPTQLKKSDIVVLGPLKKQLPFKIIDQKAQNYKYAWDFLLDDSGSMSGQKTTDLLAVTEEFITGELLSYSIDSVCKITWFSSSFKSDTLNYVPCNSINFPLSSRGEYGGTNILPALKNSLTQLNSLDTTHLKSVVIVSDGADSSSSSTISALESTKNGTEIFTYIIGNSQGHSLEGISDHIAYNSADLESSLAKYLENVGGKVSNQEILRVQKN